MISRAWLSPALAVAALALLATAAPAEGRNPGSLLVFPEYDNSLGRSTLLTITNVNSNALTGHIRVELVYIRADGLNGSPCSETNFTLRLTPNDTVTLLTSAHNPDGGRGYAYAFAKDDFGRAVSFDWLIGDNLVLDGVLALDYAITPVTFRAIPHIGQPTDVDSDGVRDLNGVEYERAPAKVLIPRFLGQNATYQSELVLINLTGGSAFTASLDFLVYNDNEEVFSRNLEFRCWTKLRLTTISSLFTHNFLANFTNHNPAEVLGAPTIESGWMEIDGGLAWSSAAQFVDPAFLAVLVEETGGLGGAELPFFVGTQANGDLLPRGLLGDSN